MSNPIGGIFIPANSLTPTSLEAYAVAALPSVCALYKRMARPGVVFTAEQKAQIQAMVDAGKAQDAQRIILEQLRGELG